MSFKSSCFFLSCTKTPSFFTAEPQSFFAPKTQRQRDILPQSHKDTEIFYRRAAKLFHSKDIKTTRYFTAEPQSFFIPKIEKSKGFLRQKHKE